MNPSRLFRASCTALITTSASFALRSDAAASWIVEFHLNRTEIGWIDGAAFWGFALAMIFGGTLCDLLGLGRIVCLAFIGHVVGIGLTVFATDFWSLFAGTLIFGIANGSVEAACNPLIATLFPTDKTTKLNRFHTWFPGGIVLGGLLAFTLGRLGVGWKIQFCCLLVPLSIYGGMFFGQDFPRTERVTRGISTRLMFLACLRPGFLLMVGCMLLTAATELGPQQWIPNILSNAGVSGILVLVWITGLMAFGRHFAGVLVHRLSPLGMLLASAILSGLGLYSLSQATGSMLFVAATVFALGVCYFWPTMLGFVSEKFPDTGALGLAIMGGAGVFSSSLALPIIGRFYDAGIAERLPKGMTLEQFHAAATTAPAGGAADHWAAIQAAAGLETLGRFILLPSILAVIFLILFLRQKRPAAAATA